MDKQRLNSIDESLIDLALLEDLGEFFLDATTMVLFEESLGEREATIISKSVDDIVVSGIAATCAVLEKVEAHLAANHEGLIQKPFAIKIFKNDGDVLKPGEALLTITANAQTLLIAERTILNFLRHLSAIATLTRRFVDKIEHTECKILDTRKTTPGMRHFEKMAVQDGGGVNHRMGLYDAMMVKDTHVDLLGGMKETILSLPEQKKMPVIVEVRNREELQAVIQYGKEKVDRVLLDNMTLSELKASVALCQGVVDTEASGNLNLNTIKEVAETGVDYASVGMLTYSAGQVDLSMKTTIGS